MQDNSPDKPCLVETGRGFSVSYKNRFLYSKYDPKKSVLKAVADFQVLEGTLVLAFSPLLWYGIEELCAKLDKNSLILAVETDKKLYELSKEHFPHNCPTEKILFFPIEKIQSIVQIISGTETASGFDFPNISHFKRARAIEMSGGTGLDRELYGAISTACEDAVASFWKNRITLTKMGRLYSKNIFKNLGQMRLGKTRNAFVTTIEKYIKKIRRPILVVGAGESAEITLKSLGAATEKFFVLSVDAAAPLFKSLGIVPDGIVAVESQLAIEKAYIGGGAKKSVIFADITSRNQTTLHTEQEISYFATQFAPLLFLETLRNTGFFPPQIPPLGSVGLTATLLALFFRADNTVPVFVTGLDFSFSPGKTHANGTYPHISRLSSTNRFFSAENYGAAFRESAKSFVGKDGKIFFTDKALSSYALMFSHTFSCEKNLFDAGECGIDLRLSKISTSEIVDFAEKMPVVREIALKNFNDTSENADKIIRYLEGEEKALNRIKELLMFGKDVASCSVPLEKELESLISSREYLFLHFPDGFKCNVSDLSFLKRVRAETDFFLRVIHLALRHSGTVSA